ncbi:MAG: DUF5688 family protein, partial [Lachnospiraceae bacterium]|nr:DUF5688 family protein [Lachnospiraceae bacterium]
MNYSTFLEMITEEIKKQIGANAQIHVSKIQRINLPDEDGMTILFPGENAAPAIYLNSFYQEYLNGTDTTVLVEEILAFYYENKKNGACDISFYKNFEQVRNHIVCRLVNHEKNRTILE